MFVLDYTSHTRTIIDMNAAKRNALPSPHWSVDFVEHLRLVHFALMAVSAALLIIVSGTQDRRMSVALTQAMQLVEFQDRWPEIRRSLITQAARRLKCPDTAQTYYIDVAASTAALEGGHAFLKMYISEDDFFKYEPWKFTGPNMADSPRTIAEFRSWWNALHAGLTVHVPNLEERGKKCSAVLSTETGDRHAEVFNSRGDSIESTCEVGMSMSTLTEPRMAVGADMYFRSVAMASASTYDSELGVGARFVHVHESGVGPKKALTDIYVEMHGTNFGESKLDESALQGLFNWRNGTFDVAFRELSDVSEDVAQIALKNVPARLIAQQPSGDRDIEAVGLKLPVASINKWGIVVMLAIQFYFWLHLHEFNRRVGPKSPGSDVAWIGVYRSPVAFLSVMTSACLLPAVAIILLAIRLPTDLTRSFGARSAIVLAVAASILAGALAIATGERLHRLRVNLASGRRDFDG